MRIITELVNEEFSLRDTGCSNGVDGALSPTHRWYSIKESFSPKLVERALQQSGIRRSDAVIDPFCGSGTVPLAAARGGSRGIGMEVNPFMAFLSRAKLERPRPKWLLRASERVLAGAKSGRATPLENYSTFSSGGGAEKWLFNRTVLRAFEGGWHETLSASKPVREILRLALLGAAMDVCNAKRDGKCLRYKREWRDLGYGRRAFIDAFHARATLMAEDIADSEDPRGSARISIGDSRRDIARAFRGKFRLCVTSPPYLNSFDYSDVYRPELFLGKFVRTTEELRALRFRTLRSHVQVDWSRPVRSDFGALYRECAQRLSEAAREDLWSPRLPAMVQAYFEDMASVFAQLRKQARSDAKLWVVVSTSAYAGVEIPVDLILAEIGVRAGWHLDEVGVLRYLRTSGQHWGRSNQTNPQLRESVVIFDAEPRRRR